MPVKKQSSKKKAVPKKKRVAVIKHVAPVDAVTDLGNVVLRRGPEAAIVIVAPDPTLVEKIHNHLSSWLKQAEKFLTK